MPIERHDPMYSLLTDADAVGVLRHLALRQPPPPPVPASPPDECAACGSRDDLTEQGEGCVYHLCRECMETAMRELAEEGAP